MIYDNNYWQRASMLTAREAAILYSISPYTLYRWAERGHIAPAQRVGRRVYFYRSEVAKLVQERIPQCAKGED